MTAKPAIQDDDDIGGAATASTPLLWALTLHVAAAPSSSSSPVNAQNATTTKKNKSPKLYFSSEKQRSLSYYTTSFSCRLAFALLGTILFFAVAIVRFLSKGNDNEALSLLLTTTITTTSYHHHHHHHHPATVSECDNAAAFRGSRKEEHDCFYYILKPAPVQVPRNQPGFPSFWNYAYNVTTSQNKNQHQHPEQPLQFQQTLQVTYDARSIMINRDRVLLLGGSLHPGVRATRATWDLALDQAVHNGLNLITIYVFWSAHQPFPNRPLDWSFFGTSSMMMMMMMKTR
jgi:Glycosyl hydrolases family 35